MLAEQQREQFKKDVAEMKLRTGASRYDGPLRILGGVLMLVGVVAAFIIYESSLSQNDPRNIASEQILATAFLGLTLIGATLFAVVSLARLLRFWLLRQLYEGQAQIDQLASVVQTQSHAEPQDAAWPDRSNQASDAMR